MDATMTRMVAVDNSEAVWQRVAEVAPLPADLQRSAVVAMSGEEFTEMVRTHLVPRENQVAGRHRWLHLWALLTGDAELRARATATLEAMLKATQVALDAGDFALGQRQRASKFARTCHQSLQRLQVAPGPTAPLAWAGEGAAAFNASSRIVIARMVSAIATHRTAVASGGDSDAADQQLWAVLRATGLDPADHPQQRP